MGNHKAFTYNTETEHGARMAKEAEERADAKDAYKDEYKEHEIEISRDDLSKLRVTIGRQPNVGRFKKVSDFMDSDKGYWTERLTLIIKDDDTLCADYVNVHESKSEKIEALEAQLKALKNE